MNKEELIKNIICIIESNTEDVHSSYDIVVDYVGNRSLIDNRSIRMAANEIIEYLESENKLIKPI